MATEGGPSIVTDGLVLYLDAANPRSYPGSGTNWKDIINNNNGTLTNGPTFISNIGGAIDFDGVNDYISITNSTELNPSLITIQVLVNLQNLTSGTYPSIVTKSPTLGSSQYGLWFWRGGLSSSGCSLRVNNGSTSYTVNSNVDGYSTLQQWLLITATFDGRYLKIYYNGELKNTEDIGSTTTITSTSNPLLIATDGESRNFDGYVASTAIYNKALSTDEVLQNYNAVKQRFK